jgi:hypothetical protein
MKYISKTYTDTNKKNVLTQSLCWLFNIRSYQCSRKLITPLKKGKSDSGFSSKYLVIVNDEIPISFLLNNMDFVNNLSNPFYFYGSKVVESTEIEDKKRQWYFSLT